jgi:hypothetical protein
VIKTHDVFRVDVSCRTHFNPLGHWLSFIPPKL